MVYRLKYNCRHFLFAGMPGSVYKFRKIVVYCHAWPGISPAFFGNIYFFNLLADKKIEVGICLYGCPLIKLEAGQCNVQLSFP